MTQLEEWEEQFKQGHITLDELNSLKKSQESVKEMEERI